MISIAFGCKDKPTTYCGCGMVEQSGDPGILEGCSPNVKFGEFLAKGFMGPNKAKSHKKKAKQHNQMIGFEVKSSC